MKKIIWVDTETTGLDPFRNGIIQLACLVEIEGKGIVEKRSFLMDPTKIGKEVSSQALEVNGYTIEEIKGFQDPFEAKRDIESVFGKYVSKFDRTDKFVVGGYNVDFDIGFLKQLWQDAEDTYFFSWVNHATIDVFWIHPFLEWAGLATVPENRRLETLARHYGFEFPDAHDAMADIEMTYRIAKAIQSKLGAVQ